MSKYRVVFKTSRIELVIGFAIAVLFVLSFWSWKEQVMPLQWLWQSILSVITAFYFYLWARRHTHKVLSPVIFSTEGQWMDAQQTSWVMTHQSRLTSLVLFINLTSALNIAHSKWLLIYRDQVSEQDYRRLCRAILFQQQLSRP